MIVSGLLVTLAGNAKRAGILRALRRRPEFTTGRVNGRWLPVAMEAPDDAASRDLHDWLSALPGVEFVDVVCVSFDDSSPRRAADRPRPAKSTDGPWRAKRDSAAPRLPGCPAR
jgi:hypothetical protein